MNGETLWWFQWRCDHYGQFLTESSWSLHKVGVVSPFKQRENGTQGRLSSLINILKLWLVEVGFGPPSFYGKMHLFQTNWKRKKKSLECVLSGHRFWVIGVHFADICLKKIHKWNKPGIPPPFFFSLGSLPPETQRTSRQSSPSQWGETCVWGGHPQSWVLSCALWLPFTPLCEDV